MAKDILPDWGRHRLMEMADSERFSGFLPDQAKFDQALKSKLDEFMAQLPIGEEAFNADLASRGVFGAGEAPAAMYRDVYAPIARAGATAIGQSELDYSNTLLSARIQGEQLYQNAVNALIDAVMKNDLTRLQQGFDWSGLMKSVGKLGTTVALSQLGAPPVGA